MLYNENIHIKDPFVTKYQKLYFLFANHWENKVNLLLQDAVLETAFGLPTHHSNSPWGSTCFSACFFFFFMLPATVDLLSLFGFLTRTYMLIYLMVLNDWWLAAINMLECEQVDPASQLVTTKQLQKTKSEIFQRIIVWAVEMGKFGGRERDSFWLDYYYTPL